ncbi:MAG: 6-phosphogluconolactonase, partial [Acidimicrobiales bacterium]
VSVDVETEADRYGALIRSLTGPIEPPVIDVVQLGLGTDGHTASLVPGDPVLGVVDRPVAVTGEYRGHRRMTLTAPVLSAARSIIWMVAGSDKADAVERLLASDPTIPASLVHAASSTILVDRSAAPPNA